MQATQAAKTRFKQDAVEVRKHIREAEAVSDELILAFAKLKQAMLLARRNPLLEVGSGQAALMRLVKVEQQAVAISTDILRVHDALSQVVRETAGPDEGDTTVIPASGGLEATSPVSDPVTVNG